MLKNRRGVSSCLGRPPDRKCPLGTLASGTAEVAKAEYFDEARRQDFDLTGREVADAMVADP